MSLRNPVEIKENGVAYIRQYARMYLKGGHKGKTEVKLEFFFNFDALPVGVSAESVITTNVIAFTSICWQSPRHAILTLALKKPLRESELTDFLIGNGKSIARAVDNIRYKMQPVR